PLSEHPPDTPAEVKAGNGNVTKGSAWTAAQVAAVVKGGLWPKVAIFVTWDDWGGWYDHVDPPLLEKWTDGTQFRYGGRVPCLVLSPYAKAAFISHAVHSHVSLLRFCENTFGLPSLNARTGADDGMADCFHFQQKPLQSPA
ncbi:MAG TPA: alkaline phosphatase family protein, partial [Gemmatimonadales bacterium]